MRNLTAHGKTYTEATANARIAELEALNAELGPSDGRVTEINAIREAMSAAAVAQIERDRAAREREDAEREAAILSRARVELRYLERNTPGIGRIDYTDLSTGRRRVARYETRDGFLRSYIKLASNPRRYDLHHVDEN